MALPPQPLSAHCPAVEVSENKQLNQRVLLSGCAEGRLCAWSVATSSHPQTLGLTHQESAQSGGFSGQPGSANATPTSQILAGIEGSGSLMWGPGGSIGAMIPGAPDGVGDAWDVFGEPLFSVHALTEPVWQIVLPPQSAPPQWQQCDPRFWLAPVIACFID